MPAEDEATGGPAWPDSLPSSSSGQAAEVVEFGRPSTDGETSFEDGLVRTADSADLLRLPSTRSDTFASGDGLYVTNLIPGGGSGGGVSRVGSMLLQSPSSSRSTGAFPAPLNGRPPMPSQRPLSGSNGAGLLGSSDMVPASPLASSFVAPSSPSQQPPLYQLGPLMGPRPSKTSKMTLCKVIGEATGKTIKTGRVGSSSNEEQSKHMSLIASDESLSPHSKRMMIPTAVSAGPAALDEAAAAHKSSHHAASWGMRNVCSTEIDISSLNPLPRARLNTFESDC